MKHFIIGLAIVLIGTDASGQAWTKDKGRSFLKLDFTSITGNKLFNDKSEVVDFRDYSFNTASFYGEHGISNKLTVVGYIPFLQSNTIKKSSTESKVSNSGFGDVDLGFRYALSKEKFPLAITVMLGIPSGAHTDENQLYTGDGEFNQIVKLASGVGKGNWWLQGGIGYNNRSKDFSDEMRFDAEFGYKLLKSKLLAMLKFTGVSPLDNGKAPLSATGLFSNNVSYFAPAIELMYYIKPKYGVAFRGAGASPASRNVQATPSLSFAFFADL
jgi:protein XagA